MGQISAGNTIAGRYEVENRLDAGGRAQVWAAVDKDLDRPVAVKILETPEGGDESFIEAFRNEAQAEAGLKHPNIVEVFDWGHDGDANYIVMEFLSGRSLSQILNAGPIPSEEVVSIGRQVAAALAYAHGNGIAHGALNDEQIIVAPNGHATIIGFGLRCRGTCEIAAMPDADTHAFGGLLYELLTGSSPWGPRPESVPETRPWPEHPHRLVEGVPGEFDRIIMRAISPDPSERYATAAALSADLDALAAPKDRRWLWVAIVVTAVVLASLATWYFSSQRQSVVPDVVGQPQEQASSALTASGFKMVVTGQTPSAAMAPGSVVSQNPTAGSNARRGSEIGTVLSGGKPTATVPSVAGIDLQSASKQITGAGFIMGSVARENSDTYPKDTVMSQSPGAGEVAVLGSSVDLTVSAGQATTVVPNVKGMSRKGATAKLTNVGLVVDAILLYSNDPSGTVVAQSPAAQSTVPSGSTVTMSVSKGPQPVTVPKVVGAAVADAKTSLHSVGLVPVSSETSGTSAQVGLVISQNPKAGTQVRPGSQVKIVVGK